MKIKNNKVNAWAVIDQFRNGYLCSIAYDRTTALASGFGSPRRLRVSAVKGINYAS